MPAALITDTLLREFSAALRSRGARYHDEGRVQLVRAGPDAIHATVRGSSLYTVSIVRSGRGARVSCTCPYAADHTVCKHLWSVVLAAQERRTAVTPPDATAGSPRRVPEWRRRLERVRRQVGDPTGSGAPRDATKPMKALSTPLEYRLQLDHLRSTGTVLVDVVKPGGGVFGSDAWLRSANPADRALAHLLLGAERVGSYSGSTTAGARRFIIPPAAYGTTLRRICNTGRCTFASYPPSASTGGRVVWDAGGVWGVRFTVEAVSAGGRAAAGWRLRGWFRRGAEQVAMEDAVVVTAHGLLVTAAGVARVRIGGSWPLVHALRTDGPITAPADALFELAAQLLLLPGGAEIDLPEDAGLEQVRPVPVPRLQVNKPKHGHATTLPVTLSFDYDGLVVNATKRDRGVIDGARRRVVYRSRQLERAARERLEELGVTMRTDWSSGYRRRLVVPAKQLNELVLTLVAEGWHVQADGRLHRAATQTEARISSGIDWFDLEGGVSFGEQHAPLPAALAAVRRGERLVQLDDGSAGILPLEWLQRYAAVAELGMADEGAVDGAIRFRRGQAALLDALLAAQPEVAVDESFARIRTELRGFDRIAPVAAPRGFRGQLRAYQQEGLGWMAFLRRLGVGGCLADDMGLGKTVQVLALLEGRRQEGAGPSLVVVPKSLVLNWINEAARFTPQLRVRNYTGVERRREPLDPGGCDVVISTYGTLRRDAPELSAIEFDYVILDEAQAIKNAASVSARAARLLRGQHRLALTGTPIENHVGELWSLFEFLNPGLLGTATAFTALRPGARNAPVDEETRGLLARALRPFLLRRTKEQVAPELPARTEQTLFVELEGEQRKLYDSLRQHYRQVLLGHVDSVGLTRSKMRILEALLRLRQAACHPGLIDPARRGAASAKLPLLLETLEEVVAEGHRALVFSQFTSFLALVRERLDRARIRYEYLDGRTRDRQAAVDRFQTDTSCPVFLISLRAGGYGLNLTGADYVFLLDPWWNPAVEAQAIDRTHRIGQSRPVVAMRLIAKDTVEEKVLALQQSKRELADAVLGEDAGLLSRITREDLELLLG